MELTLTTEQIQELISEEIRLRLQLAECRESKIGARPEFSSEGISDNDAGIINQIGMISERIRKIHETLATATVAQPNDRGRVVVGTRFEAELTTPKGENLGDVQFTLVAAQVGRGSYEMVSLNTPFGAAVEGKTVGDKFSYATPEGKIINGTITSIAQKDNGLLSNGCDPEGYGNDKPTEKVKCIRDNKY